MSKLRNLTLALGLSTIVFTGSGVAADLPKITVYKTPTCGCCKQWVSYLEDNAFAVETVEMRDLARLKSMSGITPQLASCHTARIGDYVIEGHVPAEDIKRLLAEHPAVKGLSAPGMPQGAPGMEYGRKDPYQVLSFDAAGETQVYAQH